MLRVGPYLCSHRRRFDARAERTDRLGHIRCEGGDINKPPLGRLLRDQGDLAAARPLQERALAIREKVLGPGHPDTATSLNDLAHLLMDQGHLAAAQPRLERALAIREKVQGPEHPDTAKSRENLALLLKDQRPGGAET